MLGDLAEFAGLIGLAEHALLLFNAAGGPPVAATLLHSPAPKYQSIRSNLTLQNH